MNDWVKRTEYNKVISLKLIIPGSCNAKCVFCYMNDKKLNLKETKKEFLDNFINSINQFLKELEDKNPVSLDITGNEPTLDVSFLGKVLTLLKESGVQRKFTRVTLTTNGVHIEEIIPYLKDVVDYVNLSVHDYREDERKKIMGISVFPSYAPIIKKLNDIGITVSCVSVLYKPVINFQEWFSNFVDWCKEQGFISLRFRWNVFWDESETFENYMDIGMHNSDYQIINHENTPDSHWCRLRRYDGFRVFFLKGVLDTSECTKGIEYVIAEDGQCYCDFYKKTKLEDYEFKVGEIYDMGSIN